MTSKEALERLKESLEDEVGSFCWINELYGIVLKDLERLEALEKENWAIKSDYDFWCKAVESAELPKLMCEIGQLKQEIEKLKKAIECMKKCVKIIVKDCDFPIYDTPRYTLGIRAHYLEENPNGLIVYIKKEEYELLKEVFENEL